MSKVSVNEIVDKSKLNKFFIITALITIIIVITDGYAMNVYGLVIPTLINEGRMNALQAGILASYSLYGMMFGSILFGMLADKVR